MVAFKFWAHFGVFRDPLTITQNLTFVIPPKTTIGGVLASILGIDYNEYFNDPEYFNFEYSVILDNNNPVRKKSFTQNYIEDYTKKSALKLSSILDLQKTVPINDEKKQKIIDKIDEKIPKPKPINRELLINPSYIIVVNGYKHEALLIEMMQKHYSAFLLYMGNSEFPANYELLKCDKIERKGLLRVDSFTQNLNKIKFESERKYSTIHFATRVVGKREYRDYKKIVICNKPISFTNEIDGYTITLENKEYNCEFI